MARCKGLWENKDHNIKPSCLCDVHPSGRGASQLVGQKSEKNSRVSVAVLDATEVSLDCQKDPGVPGAAVLQQGGSGLSGGLRGSAVQGGGCKHKAEQDFLKEIKYSANSEDGTQRRVT